MNLCGGKWPVAIQKKQKYKQTNKQPKQNFLERRHGYFWGAFDWEIWI